MICKIGSINCLNFKSVSKKDVSLFAKILREQNYDIIAFQEIQSKEAMDKILLELNNGTNKPWEGFHESQSETRTSCNHYEYAFIWNTKHVHLPQNEKYYGSALYKNISYPRIYKQYRLDRKQKQIDLRYEPFYGRFQFKNNGRGPVWEIRLINTHLMFSKGKAELDIGQTLMRRNELDILTKILYDSLSDRIYKNSSAQTAYTILLGDYNLNRKDSGAKGNQLCVRTTNEDEYETVYITDGNKKKEIITIQSGLTTLRKNECEQNEDCNQLANNYDHFTFDNIRFGKCYKYVSAVDVTKFCNDYKEYRDKISDHIPISIEIEF